MINEFLKYLQFEKRVSAHTILAYENDLQQFRKHLLNTSESDLIENASHLDIRSWVASLTDEKLAATSVNRKIASLRAFYRFLLRQEIRDLDPTKKIIALKTKKTLPRFVKEGEISTVLESPLTPFTDTFEGIRDKTILEVLYATGMRLSELINLTDNSVDLYNNTIKVLGKRNKERVIPIHRSLVTLLKAYKERRNSEVDASSECFFVTEKGERCYPMMIQRLVIRYLRENTTVEKRSPHVLRHSFATHMLNQGAEINAVKDLLGHASLAATQVYTHNTIDKLKKAFEQAHPKA